jgi:membrane-bound lytic murein transglycosylase D
MIVLKNLILLALMLILVTASDPFFGIELSLRPIPKEEKSDVRERSWQSTEAFRTYLMDEDDRVSDIFRVSEFYYPNVNFWFMIYTQFESSSVIIHDKNNLALIYKVLDFSSLHEKKLPKNTLYVLQQKISMEKVEDVEKDLERLAMNPFSLSPSAKRMYRIFKQAGVKLPILKSERSIYFGKLKDNLRTQTGQKNFIREGVIRSLPYRHFITTYFTDRRLPKELLAVPFLESSFNPQAESKVNALGIWQFMPLIASYYVPKKTNTTDYRSNVGVASVSAGFLMSENFKIMKSWDLAVTAYNSGTKHLLKTKRELGGNTIDLEAVIKHSDSQHFGFASKNFYSEFLALVHTLAYREELFRGLHQSEREDVDEDLKFFLTKCSLKLPKVLNENQLEDVEFHNHQIKNISQELSRGFIVTAKSFLPKTKFHQIPYKELLKTKPKDWEKYLRYQSCSTK